MECTVLSWEKPEEVLGISFKGLQTLPYCQVEGVQKNGVASEDGEINEGDLVMPVRVTQQGTPPKLLLTKSCPPTYNKQRSCSVTDSVAKPKHVPVMSSHSVEFGELPQYRQLMQHIPLQNLLTGAELSDRLHSQSTKVCRSWRFF